MGAKLLLCVSADQAAAAVWRGRRLTDIRHFSNDQQGWAAFGGLLRNARGIPLRIMVDTIDEDYRFETLPYVSGSDRAEMVGRKLRQLYRTTPYTAWSLQERMAGKRRDARFLFAAITSPDLLAPWLQVVRDARTPVEGIFPLPMVSLGLIERLKLRDPNLLIVTKNGAGLRQTYCRQLKFRLSRLTAARESGASDESYFATEIGNTRMYLDALTVTHVDDPVTVLILDSDETLAALPATIERLRPNLRCVRLGREEIASRLGVSATDLQSSADALHLYLLGSGRPAIDVAPAALKTGFDIYRLQQLTYAGAGVAALVALAWLGANGLRIAQSEERIVELGAQIDRYQTRYREVTSQFPQAPASADEMRDAVETANRIRSRLRTPESMFVVISKALDASPDIALKHIEWRRREEEEATAPSPAAGSAGAAPTKAAEGRQLGIVSAEVHGNIQNQRSVLARIQRFAAQLGSNRMVQEVKVLKLPVDLNASSGISGSTASIDQPDQGTFQVAVVFRPGV
ncbi:MAG TPA: hypothetical protein VFB20_02365 [Burkholderiales bacterium]|nr:hypothetical protein [Burkholderiales bacterium]